MAVAFDNSGVLQSFNLLAGETRLSQHLSGVRTPRRSGQPRIDQRRCEFSGIADVTHQTPIWLRLLRGIVHWPQA